jgi:3-deoxy-D-manno-octulosonic-acid transferase
MALALDLLYLIGIVLASPWLVWRHLSRRWSGGAGRRPLPPGAPAGGIWLHGSSVGEVSLIGPLIGLLERRCPELPIVISSHTATGVEAALKAYPAHTVFRLPFDFSRSQQRLMRRLRPALLVIVESDFWPNHLHAAAHQGVPVAVVNGKLSERSCRLHRWSRLVPRALVGVELVAAQTPDHAERFVGLGVPRGKIAITGNMKYDLTADDSDAGRRAALRQQLGFAESDPVVIGGSLHPKEDLDLITAFGAAGGAARARLVLVPRYPAQAPRVIQHAHEAGLEAIALSEFDRDPARAAASGLVIVVDRLGELRRLYAAADIAFVGGSLYFRGANKGGHNLMEPAILGLPVIFGPYNFSFRETVADLRAADAGIEVRNRAELTAALAELLESDQRRAAIGARARQVVLDNQGASLRNLELLLPLLGGSASCRGNPEAAQCRHHTFKSVAE